MVLDQSVNLIKPLVLQGHERSITTIKYNRCGDLLFSSAKDANPCVWFTADGERLGTYSGHRGTVWSLDSNWDSTKLITGSADMSAILFDLETGVDITRFKTLASVRSTNFSFCGNLVCYTTDRMMGNDARVIVVDIRDGNAALDFAIENSKMAKPMVSMWGSLDSFLVTGHDDGSLCSWDIKTGSMIKSFKGHSSQITDIQSSQDGMMFLTASKDKTAKLFSTSDLEPMKVYQTERPVNSAAISPIRDHVVLGGGQEAMDVTTTSVKDGKFDSRFFHLVFEEEFARVKGHFGPINSLAFHPNGESFSSGGEDGYIRMHRFPKEYFDFNMEC